MSESGRLFRYARWILLPAFAELAQWEESLRADLMPEGHHGSAAGPRCR